MMTGSIVDFRPIAIPCASIIRLQQALGVLALSMRSEHDQKAPPGEQELHDTDERGL